MAEYRVVLPEWVITVSAVLASSKELAPRDAYLGILHLTYGYAFLSAGPDVEHPEKFSIPSGQWQRLCGICTDIRADLDPDSLTRVNYGLSWMNNSPSSYEEEKAT